IDRVLGALADDVQLALEPGVCLSVRGIERASTTDKHLLEARLGRHGGGAKTSIVGRDRPPAEQLLTFLADDGFEGAANFLPRFIPVGKEYEPGAVTAGGRQRDPEGRRDLSEKPVGHLDQDAGAVSRVRLAAAGAAVQQVYQH